MAHNIATINGKAGYIGRQAAWHELGNVTGQYMTWAEILAAGTLDYQIYKQQLSVKTKQGNTLDVDAYGMFRWDSSMRVSAGDQPIFLGTVGKDYQPIHHSVGFEMIDSLVQSADGGHYETAGALGNGEMVWGLADLSLSVNVGDDKQNAYLLFSTSHDGSMSHTYRTCMTRVVCNNTLNVALGEKAKSVLRVRHTKNAQSRIQDIHKALDSMSEDVKGVEAKLNFLVTRKVTRESMGVIMDRLFPSKKDDKGESVETTRRENILGQILANYENNDRNAFPEQRGTAYNLLNAITEYADHDRSSRGGQRAQSALFGTGDALKSKAYELIYDVAGKDMPMMRTVPVTYSTIERKPIQSTGSILDDILAEQSA